MRLKFRAWNSEHKEYETGWSYPCSFQADNFTVRVPKGITVEQSTGLKDKNGFEIFAGDIIKDRWGSVSEVTIGPIYHASREDSFAGYGFGLDTHEPEDFENYVEVLGNIHQHPELLTSHNA